MSTSPARLALLLIIALALAACGADDADPPDSADDADDAAADAGDDVDTGDEDPVSVAFFGFAQANSFAQATFSGVEQAVDELGGSAEFFDGDFDAQTQVSQIQDAITSQRFDVFVVQANDGAAVVPAVEEAIAAGITVVAEFTPVGSNYDTVEPQVDGMIFAGDVPTVNGEVLGDLGVQACEGIDPCQVVYLQGFQALPLDNARTDAVLARLGEEPSIEVVATPEGGYTVESGLQATQDVLLAHPDVDVIIGSSQATGGAEQAIADAGLSTDDIALIGNGGSRQAVTAVQEGRWFATYFLPEAEAGRVATELGIRAFRGEDVDTAVDTSELGPRAGTADVLEGITADYDD